jgi:hypothetical protein
MVFTFDLHLCSRLLVADPLVYPVQLIRGKIQPSSTQ